MPRVISSLTNKTKKPEYILQIINFSHGLECKLIQTFADVLRDPDTGYCFHSYGQILIVPWRKPSGSNGLRNHQRAATARVLQKKNKTQTSATRLSGTKLLTHHSLRMCFKLTTLQKTCNHYHRLALPKKNYHCSITYELSPTKVNEWLLLLNPQPLTAHLPQQLLQDCLLHKAWSSQAHMSQLRELVEGTTSFWNRTDTQKKKRKIKTER